MTPRCELRRVERTLLKATEAVVHATGTRMFLDLFVRTIHLEEVRSGQTSPMG